MSGIVDDLHHAAKYLEDARVTTGNAVVLLDRVSGTMSEGALAALHLLEETHSRVKRAADRLESL
jgi:hypothetical protein